MRKFDPAEFFRDHPDQGIKLSPQSIRVIFNSLSGEKKQTWKTIVTVGDIWIGKDKFKKSMGLTCFFITTASAILLYYNNQHDVINHYAQVNGIKQLVEIENVYHHWQGTEFVPYLGFTLGIIYGYMFLRAKKIYEDFENQNRDTIKLLPALKKLINDAAIKLQGKGKTINQDLDKVIENFKFDEDE